MALRLACLGFSSFLLLGHLFKVAPAMRSGVLLFIVLLGFGAIVLGLGCIAVMYANRPHMRRLDYNMALVPAVVVALVVGVVLVVGAAL